jgi:urease beta subunit
MLDQMIGFFHLNNKPIIINEGRKSCELIVKNEGERTIQVGSHFHFFEVNRALVFDREKAFGMHLDIPSGTAIRFSPGKTLSVYLTEYGGKQVIKGFNGLTNGCVKDEKVRAEAFRKARKLGFIKEDQI